jgi:hypothetical protein
MTSIIFVWFALLVFQTSGTAFLTADAESQYGEYHCTAPPPWQLVAPALTGVAAPVHAALLL